MIRFNRKFRQHDKVDENISINSVLDTAIDHSNLESLMNNFNISATSHEFFMDSYQSMFLPERRPKAGMPTKATKSYMMSHPLYG